MSGKEDEIVPGCNRGLHVRTRRHNHFGKERRRIFLERLAATCNVTASAAAAGVSKSCVYANRMKHADFRDLWQLALEQGYARLEAALLEQAFGGAVTLDALGADEPDAQEVDWDKGMELLRHHARALASRTPDNKARPQRVPIEQVAAKIIRKMKMLGVRPSDRSGDGEGGQEAGPA